jgi:7,8-dihydropterin-6-yl-methyl-4-(beta-D-ribofuranosyl)aminobenzene 5'-phosphate synthase
VTPAIRITVLAENSVNRAGLKAEHGWACLIEIGGRRVLFDTGQTELLLDKAKALGCPLEHLDAIVLSRGHYDHTGGLAAVTQLSPKAPVIAHPAAMNAKPTRDPDNSTRFDKSGCRKPANATETTNAQPTTRRRVRTTIVRTASDRGWPRLEPVVAQRECRLEFS